MRTKKKVPKRHSPKKVSARTKALAAERFKAKIPRPPNTVRAEIDSVVADKIMEAVRQRWPNANFIGISASLDNTFSIYRSADQSITRKSSSSYELKVCRYWLYRSDTLCLERAKTLKELLRIIKTYGP